MGTGLRRFQASMTAGSSPISWNICDRPQDLENCSMAKFNRVEETRGNVSLTPFSYMATPYLSLILDPCCLKRSIYHSKMTEGFCWCCFGLRLRYVVCSIIFATFDFFVGFIPFLRGLRQFLPSPPKDNEDRRTEECIRSLLGTPGEIKSFSTAKTIDLIFYYLCESIKTYMSKHAVPCAAFHLLKSLSYVLFRYGEWLFSSRSCFGGS